MLNKKEMKYRNLIRVSCISLLKLYTISTKSKQKRGDFYEKVLK